MQNIVGFIGSNFIPYFLDKYPEYTPINLDLLTYTGNLENLQACEGNSRYKFITFVEDRSGYDIRYAIDASKIELSWKAKENFENGIVKKTIEWYIKKYHGVVK